MDELNKLAQVGTAFTVKVTPKASRNQIKIDADTGQIRVYVTVVPESGKANAAVVKLLAKALGVAKSDLELLHGAKSRMKTLRVNPR